LLEARQGTMRAALAAMAIAASMGMAAAFQFDVAGNHGKVRPCSGMGMCSRGGPASVLTC